jgi:WD40 repeat protein
MQKYTFISWMLCLAYCLLLSSCQFSSPSRLSDETIRPNNAGELQILAEYPLHYVRQTFAFSPNAELIAINDGQSVSIVNLTDLSLISKIYHPFGPKIASPEQDEEEIRAIAFLSNETLVTGSSYSPYGGRRLGSLRLWNIQSGQEIAVLDEEAAVWNLIASPDGRFIAYFQSTNIILMKLDDRSIVYQTVGTNRFLENYMGFTPDSKHFAVWSGNGVKIINLETQEAASLNVAWYGSGSLGLRLSPDSQSIALWGETEIELYDLVSLEPISKLSFNYNGFIGDMSFVGDNRLIVAGRGDLVDIEIFDYFSGQSLISMDGHEDIVFPVTSYPEYPLMLSGSRDGVVKLWDLSAESLSPLLEFSLNWSAYHLAFCPNGNCFVASSDRLLQIWGRIAD